MFTIQRTELGEGARHPGGLTAAEGVGDEAHRPPAEVADQQRQVEVDERPGEPGVERAAVAVAAEVDGDDVVAEGREPRRDAVEHPAVVVGAVQAEHERIGRVTPAPRPQRGAAEVDEVRPLGLRDLHGSIMAAPRARTEPARGCLQVHARMSRGTDPSRRARLSDRPWGVSSSSFCTIVRT